ncbi:MAG: large conductance mechanosensitive channel protein MscL [Flavobacteriales bacterium]|jgi:large conductance mechanosensitive channel
MVKEFKQFALRGNLIDMAVAFVMGAAFGKVVSAFIDGMVLPLVGLIQGRDFSNLYYPLSEKVRLAREIAEADGSGLSLEHAKEIGPVIAYGTFITVTIEFVIVSFFMFMVIKAMNKLRMSEEVAPAEPSKSEQLLEEIRDALKKG